MNSNTVLGKIVQLLSSDKEEVVTFASAKLADGTIVESPSFEVGESIEVVSEDGTKVGAPDGTHELDNGLKVVTEGGVITSKEEVSLEEEVTEEEPTEMVDETTEEEVTEETEDEVTINLEEVVETIEKMSYRIDELEKKLMEKEEEIKEDMEEEVEEDKKLDGAPVEMARTFKGTSKKSTGYHNSVLSKLYK